MEQPSGAADPPARTPGAEAGTTGSGAPGSGTSGSKRVRRTVGAVALGFGAVLAVVGSTLPLVEQSLVFTAERETFTTTLWGFESSSGVRIGDVGVRYGVPVVFAVVLLAVSAALVLAAPRLPLRFAGPTSVAAIGAASVLTGSVWTVGQIVLVSLSNEDTDTATTTVGSGLTALVLACLAALTGGVLVQHWPGRGPAPRRPEPGGVVVYRLPDADTTPVAEDTGGGS